MADNFSITPGTGVVIGADDISSVKYQRIKLIHGADGVNDGDVSSANPLPTSVIGSPTFQGIAADDSVWSGSNKPVLAGGVARSSYRSAVADGDVVVASYDLQGRAIISPWGPPSAHTPLALDMAGAGIGTATLISGPGATTSIFISSISLSNYHASTSADFYLKIAAGTIKFYARLPPNSSFSPCLASPIYIGGGATCQYQIAGTASCYVTVTYFLAII